MGYYAKVINGTVEEVIVAEQDFVDALPEEEDWKACIELTGNGFVYDYTDQAFYPPQPWPSWTLNKTLREYEPPVPFPDDFGPMAYHWDEDNLAFIRTEGIE